MLTLQAIPDVYQHTGQLLALARLTLPDRPLHIVSHAETMTAADKQASLPLNIFVQKSLSLALGKGPNRRLFLISGLGDFSLARRQIEAWGRLWGLSRAQVRHIQINPSWLDPLSAVGLAEGMVSPFFAPSYGVALPFDAVIILMPPILPALSTVAISLSLSQSLLFPIEKVYQLIQAYALQVYPHIPLVLWPDAGLNWSRQQAGTFSIEEAKDRWPAQEYHLTLKKTCTNTLRK